MPPTAVELIMPFPLLPLLPVPPPDEGFPEDKAEELGGKIMLDDPVFDFQL